MSLNYADVLMGTLLRLDRSGAGPPWPLQLWNQDTLQWEEVAGGGGGGGAAVLQLDWQAAADVCSGLAPGTETWTDIGVNHSFNVDNADSILLIAVSGFVLMYGAAGAASCRLVVDSAGTPVYKMLGGNVNDVTNVGCNLLAGAGTVSVSGLAGGAHTVKLQCLVQNAGPTFYCRPASMPTLESLALRVWELKV